MTTETQPPGWTGSTGAQAAEQVRKAIMLKRQGQKLGRDDTPGLIRLFVEGAVDQPLIAAWLATVASCGLDEAEVDALTLAYCGASVAGKIGPPGQFVIDKHSTGGVGDKVTLVLAPLLAAFGIPVAKLSGRSLGVAGGTIDKLESIAGLRLDLDRPAISRVLSEVGMALGSQSRTLAPGDAVTYRVREHTGAVQSTGLIAASILSKKLALGADGLVFDVKWGAGALLNTRADAEALADLMTKAAARFGIAARAKVTRQLRPMGQMVGNALEVREALETLRGQGPEDVVAHSLDLAVEACRLARPDADGPVLRGQLADLLASGRAYEVFRRWCVLQGGRNDAVDAIESGAWPAPAIAINAQRSGVVGYIDPFMIGKACQHVGAGRIESADRIDPLAGVALHVAPGQPVVRGERLATLYSNRADTSLAEWIMAVAFRLDDSPTDDSPTDASSTDASSTDDSWTSDRGLP